MSALPQDLEYQLDDIPADAPDPVAAGIAADLAAGPDAIDRAPEPKYIAAPIIPACGANLAAPGGTGKTTVVINEYVHVGPGADLYGYPVHRDGVCVHITGEDGADHTRYLLRRILEDGVACGQLSQQRMQIAKCAIKAIGWPRSKYGALVDVLPHDAGFAPSAAWLTLIEQLIPLRPALVTIDPASLFGPGERFGNDGAAFFASMVHAAAAELGACIQVVDHVSQAVARGGIVDQYAARGGTATTDNARLARQLVKFTGDEDSKPVSVSQEDIEEGRILRLHWTKKNDGPPVKAPIWLRRRGFWIEHLKAATTEEVVAAATQHRARQQSEDVQAVLAAVRAGLEHGRKQSAQQLQDAGVLTAEGKPMPRQRLRAAITLAQQDGFLVLRDLPVNERHGARKNYLDAGVSP